MHTAPWIIATGLLLTAALPVRAADGDGLLASSQSELWPRWQGRLSLGTSTALWRANLSAPDNNGPRVDGLSLLGDYYFTSSLRGSTHLGGFRATSGLMSGVRATSLLLGTSGQSEGNGRSPASAAFSVERRALGSSAPTVNWLTTDEAESKTVPYVGVGYTGLSNKGGWGFSADIGLMALNPGNAVKFGRVFGGGQSLDELLRDMRLSPLLQLGVSYSF